MRLIIAYPRLPNSGGVMLCPSRKAKGMAAQPSVGCSTPGVLALEHRLCSGNPICSRRSKRMITQCHTTPTSTVTPFTFEDKPLRFVMDDQGNPWFNASDICAVLEYANIAQTIQDHVDAEDVSKRYTLTSGGKQLISHINESGLYALIFGSTKPEAKRFKRWVTSEVLPSIRKTGSYQHPQSDVQEMLDKMLATIEEMGRELSKTKADAVMEIPAKEFAGLMKRLADSETFRAEILNAKLNPPTRQANRPVTPEEVREIRRLSAAGVSGREISRRIKRSSSKVCQVLRSF
ncbi:MAG: hypothetical protein HQL97_04420 [Magnetococcales bacterium]|nr:hypothetical protein [Magnetococcales bacterium]